MCEGEEAFPFPGELLRSSSSIRARDRSRGGSALAAACKRKQLWCKRHKSEARWWFWFASPRGAAFAGWCSWRAGKRAALQLGPLAAALRTSPDSRDYIASSEESAQLPRLCVL